MVIQSDTLRRNLCKCYTVKGKITIESNLVITILHMVDKCNSCDKNNSVIYTIEKWISYKMNSVVVNPITETPWKPAVGRYAPGKRLATDLATRPLTRKQKAFVDYLVKHPKASATKAAKETYNVNTDNSAAIQGHENLRKPNVMLELAKHSATAENTILEVMQTSKEYSRQGNTAGASYAATAVSAANSILDRLHGKATQRVEQTTQAVVLNIDLTGVTENK